MKKNILKKSGSLEISMEPITYEKFCGSLRIGKPKITMTWTILMKGKNKVATIQNTSKDALVLLNELVHMAGHGWSLTKGEKDIYSKPEIKRRLAKLFQTPKVELLTRGSSLTGLRLWYDEDKLELKGTQVITMLKIAGIVSKETSHCKYICTTY